MTTEQTLSPGRFAVEKQNESDRGRKSEKARWVSGSSLERCQAGFISLFSSVQVESSMISELHTQHHQIKRENKMWGSWWFTQRGDTCKERERGWCTQNWAGSKWVWWSQCVLPETQWEAHKWRVFLSNWEVLDQCRIMLAQTCKINVRKTKH